MATARIPADAVLGAAINWRVTTEENEAARKEKVLAKVMPQTVKKGWLWWKYEAPRFATEEAAWEGLVTEDPGWNSFHAQYEERWERACVRKTIQAARDYERLAMAAKAGDGWVTLNADEVRQLGLPATYLENA